MNKLGSSETTREPTLYQLSKPYAFNFDDFLDNYQPEHLRTRSREEVNLFLQWFVGFSEGDSCFEHRIEKGRSRVSFTIKQNQAPLLYKIRKSLGFGTVRKDSSAEGIYRFTVEDKMGIRRLMAIFNGNIILPKIRCRYKNWVEKIKFWPDFQVREHLVNPSLETAWLSGLAEAEGCFYAVLTTPSQRSIQEFRLTQKFTLTQKNVLGEKKILEQISDLFESKAKLNSVKGDCFRVEIHSLKSQQIVADYFTKFCFKGKKKITAFRWWRIFLLRSDKAHYEKANKPKLKRLVNSLNASTKEQVRLKKQIQEEELPIRDELNKSSN